jgi:indole-3-glycerol phosphate synthase
MNLLQKIIEHKKVEVAALKQSRPIHELRRSPYYSRTPFSLKAALSESKSTGIIAEFKRRSPSKGWINSNASVMSVASAYTQEGAAALSILTDQEFFGGSAADLESVRSLSVPILRKDFMIDVYQIEEAKAMGADAILLIAACLSPEEVSELSACAKDLSLDVLLELHAADEIRHIGPLNELIGINNRNLKTFDVEIERSLEMAVNLPVNSVKIAESGIDHPDTIRRFRSAGFSGFLMGEHFMKSEDPGKAFGEFVTKLSD